ISANGCKAGICLLGICSPPANLPANTVCSPKADACHTDGVCDGNGNCGAQGVRTDGFNYAPGYLNRCCNGAPTQINTARNCGACGISCAGGQSCTNAGAINQEQWWCTCIGSNGCWSGCCATSTSPNVCSPSSCNVPAKCINCPGNASCTQMQTPH